MTLTKVRYVPPQMSEYLTLFFVISGNVTVMIGEKKYDLYADDLVVVNPFQYYQIESIEKNLLLTLCISKAPILSSFKEDWLPYIECSKHWDSRKSNRKSAKITIIVGSFDGSLF